MSYMGGMSYLGDMGFTPVVTGEPTSSLIATAASGFMDLIGSLHIRAGANEADQIVPVQNRLGDYLGTIDGWLKQPLTVPQLQQIRLDLLNAWQQFMDFIWGPGFTADGDTRASDGAQRTMEWQVYDRIGQIEAKIRAAGGTVQAAAPIQGAGQSIQRLTTLTGGQPYFPQAGTLPPTNMYPQPGTQSQGEGWFDDIERQGQLLVLGGAALVGYLLFSRGD